MCTQDGCTPLFWAVYSGFPAIVRFLVPLHTPICALGMQTHAHRKPIHTRARVNIHMHIHAYRCSKHTLQVRHGADADVQALDKSV